MFGLEHLSWKRKERLLYAGLAILMLLIWVVAIVPTRNLQRELRRLNEYSTNTGTITEQIKSVEEELVLLDGLMTDRNADQDVLAALVGLYAEDKGAAFRLDAPVSVDLENYRMTSRVVMFGGTYHEALELMHRIEHMPQVGRLSSAKLEMEYDRRSRKNVFQTTLWIQQIAAKP